MDLVGAELSALVGVRGRPRVARIVRWPRAIPQAEVGHGRYLDLCAAAEAAAPGLHIGGNFRNGISVSQCIASGARLAAAVAAVPDATVPDAAPLSGPTASAT